MASKEYKNSYSNKPLWQWILIYLVIGGIVYALIYYFVFAKKGGYNYLPSMPAEKYASPSTNSLY